MEPMALAEGEFGTFLGWRLRGEIGDASAIGGCATAPGTLQTMLSADDTSALC